MLKPRDCMDVALLGWRWLCWPGGGSWCQRVGAKLLRLLNVDFAGTSTAEAELGPPERILTVSQFSKF